MNKKYLLIPPSHGLSAESSDLGTERDSWISRTSRGTAAEELYGHRIGRKKYSIPLIYFFGNVFNMGLFAAVPAQWQCTVGDQQGRQWTAHHRYQRLATNLADEACKKKSNFPRSCHRISDTCEAFNAPQAMSGLWQCFALDQLAQTWAGDISLQSETALLSAKAICRAHSRVPETCYALSNACKKLPP